MMSPQGIEFAKRHEGWRAKAYKDVGGTWTIGYGHIGIDAVEGREITKARGEQLLKEDIRIAESAINELMAERKTRRLDELHQHQVDALIDFVFNVGASGFKRSETYRRMLTDSREAPYAPAAFLTWTKAGGVRSKGLVTGRRWPEYCLFMFGDYDA
jgi:lysozyme